MMAEKYLKLTTWARNRYSYEGNLIVSVGGVPTKYTRIERAAWTRYMA